jgi:hypothetical protein
MVYVLLGFLGIVFLNCVVALIKLGTYQKRELEDE